MHGIRDVARYGCIVPCGQQAFEGFAIERRYGLDGVFMCKRTQYVRQGTGEREHHGFIEHTGVVVDLHMNASRQEGPPDRKRYRRQGVVVPRANGARAAFVSGSGHGVHEQPCVDATFHRDGVGHIAGLRSQRDLRLSRKARIHQGKCGAAKLYGRNIQARCPRVDSVDHGRVDGDGPLCARILGRRRRLTAQHVEQGQLRAGG
ncbi:hypothetical protein DYST_00926 [Dyella terrae]|nr:hypothetical protein DYST_00926 [Dyella terrae]